jgi:SAM-dependent methyltransferase
VEAAVVEFRPRVAAGRRLARRLGYPLALLDAVPAGALACFAGAGYHLELAALAPGERVLDLGTGSGTDAFSAAVQVGEGGAVVGVGASAEELRTARWLRDSERFAQVEFIEAHLDALPFPDASFDAVLANGVIDRSPSRALILAETARVLRPGGEVVASEVMPGDALAYLRAFEDAGLRVHAVQDNDAAGSISLAAIRAA